jgi:[methyl-Co(III) methanol-specific corrinoid protein]:coenzyme M methyltransferase
MSNETKTMSARERVLAALAGEPTDRPAVVCPGGMMSMAVTEVMASSGAAWPEAHTSDEAMLRLALAMQETAGFDSIAMPFCMTVEAEAYGATVDLGNLTTQPRVRGSILPADGSGRLPAPDFGAGRAAVLLRAMRKARALRPDVAIIGNLVGPFSALGMLCDPLQLLRWTRRAPETAARHLGRISEDLVRFGLMQKEAGADAICIADPTATGEILGGPRFRASVLPHLARVARDLRAVGARIIIHICGDVAAIEPELRDLAADAVSFDSVADIAALASFARMKRATEARAASRPPWQVMGNVSPFLLKEGPVDRIVERCRQLIEGGVRLLAPACGVIPTTPLAHLRAMRQSVERI